MDQPSETIWCRFKASTCSFEARRQRLARIKGPRLRSNGWMASSLNKDCSTGSRSFSGWSLRSMGVSEMINDGKIFCTGLPLTRGEDRAQDSRDGARLHLSFAPGR